MCSCSRENVERERKSEGGRIESGNGQGRRYTERDQQDSFMVILCVPLIARVIIVIGTRKRAPPIKSAVPALI